MGRDIIVMTTKENHKFSNVTLEYTPKRLKIYKSNGQFPALFEYKYLVGVYYAD